MAGAAPILKISDVRYRWPGRASFELSIADFSVKAGESVLLLGESGSGKSTLLSLICGAIVPDSGSIEVDGTNISNMSASKRDRFRAEQIGVIFQQFNLLPFGSVSDNIRLPLRFAPKRGRRVEDPRSEAQKLCASLNLPPELLHARAANLSVGQQQRVAVARALIGQPPLILADEPTSALDAGSQNAFLDLLFSQAQASGLSLVMVSHDPRLSTRFDRVVQLEDLMTKSEAAS